MKKKIRGLVLVVTLVMILLCACGGKDMSDSVYLGTWEASTAEYSGMELSVDTLFDEFHFTLQDNGKVKLNLNGEEETGKWEETDTGVILEDEMEFTKVDENTLSYETDGMNVYFVRQ